MTASVIEQPEAQELRRMDRRLLRGLWEAKPWMATGFAITSFAYGTALFVVLVTLIALGGGLAITLLGIPVLWLAFQTWKWAAILERQRIRLFFGERIESPYRPIPKGTLFQRAKAQLLDPAVWKDLLYDFLLFPIGVAEFTIAAVVLSIPVMFLAAPSYFWIDSVTIFGDSSTGTGWQLDTFPEALLACAAGALLIVPAAWLVVAMANGHKLLARWLLSPSRQEELEERVDVLTKTRSDVMDAMLLERRRIERDLHDGAQQRLVSLAMNLGRAKEKMASDPEGAQELITTSHEEAKQALGELRELVRGIHPAVLTDRGLDAAISAIAGRCPAPVTVNVALEERPPEAVESTAYFIVAEALTNIAKHSEATHATVRVMKEPGTLLIDIWDNGKGGATMTPDHGLGGLADRVAALDGRFAVVSPAQGGTRVFAEIPCA
jgi:signal transduction histidine kinase